MGEVVSSMVDDYTPGETGIIEEGGDIGEGLSNQPENDDDDSQNG